MSYDDVISDLVRVIEAVGAAIMVVGGLIALALYVRRLGAGRGAAYIALRQDLGRVILLGLEVLIIADIIRTIVVDPTIESVGVLGVIVLIRILLSFSLEVEIDGMWPWNRWKIDRAEGSQPSPTRSDRSRTPSTITAARGCSSEAEHQLPKLRTRVRFPSPAPLHRRRPFCERNLGRQSEPDPAARSGRSVPTDRVSSLTECCTIAQ